VDGGEEIECMNEMLGCDDKVDDDVDTGKGWTTPGIRSIIARRQTEGSPRVLQVLREFYKQAFLHYIQYVYGLRKEAYRYHIAPKRSFAEDFLRK
jgi:hypothetical protein